ncbi:MAG: CTP-dependent riboflavin kinase [Desulfurococcales archaeon]|nr:CTP-dependent riboflavin kinase [Desulfurococcales archaeon]
MRKIVKLVGRVVPGIGEGRYYVNLYRDNIRQILKIDPYPGTLNIDVGVDVSKILADLSAILIPPPSKEFAMVLAYPARVNNVYGYILKPCISIHGWNILEFITEINMREKYGLKDGDHVIVYIWGAKK